MVLSSYWTTSFLLGNILAPFPFEQSYLSQKTYHLDMFCSFWSCIFTLFFQCDCTPIILVNYDFSILYPCPLMKYCVCNICGRASSIPINSALVNFLYWFFVSLRILLLHLLPWSSEHQYAPYSCHGLHMMHPHTTVHIQCFSWLITVPGFLFCSNIL